MDTNRFDTISRLFASRRSRRNAVATGAGLTVAALGSRTLAQEGTPAVATPAVDPSDPHPSADDAQADPEFLFVQPFESGAWAPKDGEDGVYTLTLSGAAANTVYFSDRPERIVGSSPTRAFLDGLGFTPENPPNAAVVAQRETEEDQEILVIELLDPVYDADAETLTYDARVLADYGEPGLAHLARQQQDYELGETFGAGGLFIDGCPDLSGECVNSDTGEHVGNIVNIPQCYVAHLAICLPCDTDGESITYGKLCNAAYGDYCPLSSCYWDHSAVCGWGCVVDEMWKSKNGG